MKFNIHIKTYLALSTILVYMIFIIIPFFTILHMDIIPEQ